MSRQTKMNEEDIIDTNRIIRLGNVSTGNSQAGMVYDIDGIFPAVCAGTHGYAMGYICVGEEED